MFNTFSFRNLLVDDDNGAQLDLTNLIDLMTVICGMLMLFLSTATVLAAQVELQKVDFVVKERSPADQPTATLSFTKDGTLFWNNVAVTWKQLEDELRRLSESQDSPAAYIAGDRECTYGFSLKVLALFDRHQVTAKPLVEELE